jgi:Na+/H+-dicarboxylate symporter
MTIIPLVAALLVTGIARMVATARAGALARRTLLWFVAVLAGGTLLAALATPVLLELFPIPGAAAAALAADGGAAQPVPGIGAFLETLVAPNVVAAAAETAMLPLVVFFAVLALAITRLPEAQGAPLLTLFEALGEAMLVVIGWVLRLAPLGVFALAIGVAARSGGGAIAALGHYIVVVASLGVAVLLAAYGVALLGARRGLLRFGRAMLPAQAVALSTQSSLASLPAMLAVCRTLGVRETTADFVLPLAVAVFRATSPAMNLAVAIYVARLTGVPLTPATIAAGAAVALVTTVGSVSLPGAVSFVTSVGPIALAMGVRVEPLALLVAVEMLPDLVRTLGNVTMDTAVTATVDRSSPDSA